MFMNTWPSSLHSVHVSLSLAVTDTLSQVILCCVCIIGDCPTAHITENKRASVRMGSVSPHPMRRRKRVTEHIQMTPFIHRLTPGKTSSALFRNPCRSEGVKKSTGVIHREFKIRCHRICLFFFLSENS